MSDGNTVTNCFIGTNKTGTAAITNDVAGIILSSDNNTIGGSGNLISGNTTHGIEISGGDNTTVKGNKIGTDVNGTAAIANGSDGINVIGMNNTVGGTNASDRNIISGNSSDGVTISGAGSTGNLVQGNYIGTDVNGNAALANNDEGVLLISSASSNTIGGTTAGAANVISGNSAAGVRIEDAGTTGNLVQGNTIGLGSDGTTVVGNVCGVFVCNVSSNTIGGSASGARNVISGNDGGVFIDGNSNIVQGNYIGTDATGTLDRGNTNIGVCVDSGNNNRIGGAASGEGNVISGNDLHGVQIQAISTLVEGNLIGTQADGVTALGNAAIGVRINTGNNNTVGGTAAGASNTIAFNGQDGVVIEGTVSGNAVLSNSIFSNTQLGIDLGDDGVTANDVDDVDAGDNNLQNFPLLTSVYTLLNGVGVQGSLNSIGATAYRIEFFGNATADPTGNGEGETFLGFTSVTTSSTVSFTVGLPGTAVPIGNFITATATDPNNNTSEFSDTLTVQFGVSAVSPVLHDIDGSAAANLTATFSDNMLVGAAGTFVVHGSLTGNRTGSGAYAGGGTTALSFNPTADFKPGEEVEVTLTTGLQNTGATPLAESFVWKHLAAAGTGPAEFSAESAFGTGSDITRAVVYADVDGDGDVDILLGNGAVGGEANTVALNDGAGIFTAGTTFGTGSDETYALAVGDVDGDGDLDVAVGNLSAQNTVYLNNGSGSFTDGSNNFGPGDDDTRSSVFGDVDGDGDLDIMVGSGGTGGAILSTILSISTTVAAIFPLPSRLARTTKPTR